MNLRLGLHNVALHLLVLVWVAAGAAQARLGPGPRAALEPLRSGWLLVALAGLAGLMPLGAVLLALAVSVTAARGLLASAAALAAAWIVGAGDYSLSGPLQHKALALVAAGAALGALAGWAWSPTPGFLRKDKPNAGQQLAMASFGLTAKAGRCWWACATPSGARCRALQLQARRMPGCFCAANRALESTGCQP